MEQTNKAVTTQQIHKGRKQTRDSIRRTEKRKKMDQEHNENQDKKKYKHVERNETDFNIPGQPRPSREWPRERPVEYPSWSRGQREYRGYQRHYEVPRGQPRGRRPFRSNGPRDFFRGQSRQWSPKPDYPPSEYQIQKVLNYLKKNDVNNTTLRDNPTQQQNYGEDVRGQRPKEPERTKLPSNKSSTSGDESQSDIYHSSDGEESTQESEDSAEDENEQNADETHKGSKNTDIRLKPPPLEFLRPEHNTSRPNFSRTLIATMPLKMKTDPKYKDIVNLFSSNLADDIPITTGPEMQNLLDVINESSELLISFPIRKPFESEIMTLGGQDIRFPRMLKRLNQSFETKEKKSWLKPEITQEWQDKAGIKDALLKEQSVLKIFDDIKKIVGQTEMSSPVALYPGFNPAHWDRIEPILDVKELDTEYQELENKIISVQGWNRIQFKQNFPNIYQANILFHRKKIYREWTSGDNGTDENSTTTNTRYTINTGSELCPPIQVVLGDENKRHTGHAERKYYRIERKRNITWNAGIITDTGVLRPAKLSQVGIQIGTRIIHAQPAIRLSPQQANLPGAGFRQEQMYKGALHASEFYVDEIPTRCTISKGTCPCYTYQEAGTTTIQTINCISVKEIIGLTGGISKSKLSGENNPSEVEFIPRPQNPKSTDIIYIKEVRGQYIELHDLYPYVNQAMIKCRGANLGLLAQAIIEGKLTRCAPNPSGAFFNDIPIKMGCRLHAYNYPSIKTLLLKFHLGRSNVVILEKEQNLALDRCSNALVIGREKECEINEFVGHPSKLGPLYPALPPTYSGSLKRIHDWQEGEDVKEYKFPNLEQLIYSMAMNLKNATKVRCTNCFAFVQISAFIHHWSTLHHDELLYITVADDWGTGQKVLSNFLAFIIICMQSASCPLNANILVTKPPVDASMNQEQTPIEILEKVGTQSPKSKSIDISKYRDIEEQLGKSVCELAKIKVELAKTILAKEEAIADMAAWNVQQGAKDRTLKTKQDLDATEHNQVKLELARLRLEVANCDMSNETLESQRVKIAELTSTNNILERQLTGERNELQLQLAKLNSNALLIESKQRIIETLQQKNNALNDLMEAHTKEFTCIPNPVPVSYTSDKQPSSSTQEPADIDPVDSGTGTFPKSIIAPSFDGPDPFGISGIDSEESSDNIITHTEREISDILDGTGLIEETAIVAKDIPSENKTKRGRKKGKNAVK